MKRSTGGRIRSPSAWFCTSYVLEIAPSAAETSAVIFHGILSQTPARLRQHRSDAPVELEAIIAKMLEKDPQRRYQSASDVATDLRGLKRRLDAAALTPGEDSSPSNISASSGSWVLPAGKPEWVFDFLRRFERAGGGQQCQPAPVHAACGNHAGGDERRGGLHSASRRAPPKRRSPGSHGRGAAARRLRRRQRRASSGCSAASWPASCSQARRTL